MQNKADMHTADEVRKLQVIIIMTYLHLKLHSVLCCCRQGSK